MRNLFKILIFIFMACSIVCFSILGWYYYQRKIENKSLIELAENVQSLQKNKDNDDKNIDSDTKKEKTIMLKYSKLHKQNEDLFGWIRIDGTDINYPVMFTPANSEYYLQKDFNGKCSSSGLPFIDSDTEVEGSHNLMIYGHNMKNGAIFASLINYEDKAYWEKHKYISFDTLYEEHVYEIIAVFPSKILNSKESGFPYYKYINISDEVTFNEYIQNVMSLALYNIGTKAKYGDELITLSTCSYHTNNGRFVVVAKKIK